LFYARLLIYLTKLYQLHIVSFRCVYVSD
jgi:hypothetical protein